VVCLVSSLLLCSSGFIWAQEPNQTPASAISAAERNRVAQQFIDGKLAFWRQRLKLDAWQVSAVMVRRSELPPQTMGGIHWDKAKKSAVVWVLNPADYRLPFDEMLNDMELTIVHELVHLNLAFLPEGQTSRGSEERAVDGIAQAMLGRDRGLDRNKE
jgi:hypothetical protein